MLKRRTFICISVAFLLAFAGPVMAADTDLSTFITDSEDPVAPDSIVSYEVEVANAGPDDSPFSIILDITLPMNVPMQFQEYLQLDEEGRDAVVDEILAGLFFDENIWEEDVSGVFVGDSLNNGCEGLMIQPQELVLPAMTSGKFYFDAAVPSVGGVAGVAYTKADGELVTLNHGIGGCNSTLFDDCGTADPVTGVPCMGPRLTWHTAVGAPVFDTQSDGCDPLVDFPAGYVALIDRGACNFSAKGKNATDAGATGVLIANTEGYGVSTPTDDSVIQIGCSDAVCHSLIITIPSAFLSYNDAAALRVDMAAKADGEVTMFMGIREEDPEYRRMRANIWESSGLVDPSDVDPDNDLFIETTTLGLPEPPPCTPIYIAAAASFPDNSPPWASDLGINNNSDEALTYKFKFLPAGSDNTDVAFTEEFILEPNTNANFVDIWNTYAGEGFGSINVCVSDPDAAGVTSRIYTTNVLGTIGQGFVGMAGLTPEKLIGTGERVRLGFLKQTGTKNQVVGFRTNVGFMNAGGATITVDADFYGALGNWLGNRSVDLAPYSSAQWNDAYNNLPGVNNDVELGYIEVWSNTVDAMFLTYASVIDNRSNDPSTIWPFDTAQMVGGDALECTPVWVAAAASFPNNNPVWASDLNLTNLGADMLTYKFQFLPRGADNSDVEMSESFTLAGNQAIAYSDIWEMTGGQGAGAINVCVDNAGNAGITSRIYSIASNGTYGQTFVGMRGSAPAKVATGEKVRLGYLFENDKFRTNIGFMNAGANEITVMVEFFDMDGTSLGTKGVNLAPYSNTQWNKAYTLDPIFASGITAGFADVWTDTADANFLTYASIVDNGTGDPSTIWPF